MPVERMMSHLAGQAISLKRLDNESDAFPHPLIFKDVVGSANAGREQMEKGWAGCFCYKAKETPGLVLNKFGQVPTPQIHPDSHLEGKTSGRLAHGFQLSNDAVKLGPAFGHPSRTLF